MLHVCDNPVPSPRAKETHTPGAGKYGDPDPVSGQPSDAAAPTESDVSTRVQPGPRRPRTPTAERKFCVVNTPFCPGRCNVRVTSERGSRTLKTANCERRRACAQLTLTLTLTSWERNPPSLPWPWPYPLLTRHPGA